MKGVRRGRWKKERGEGREEGKRGGENEMGEEEGGRKDGGGVEEQGEKREEEMRKM